MPPERTYIFMKKKESASPGRMGKVGGGALIEGVMMRAGNDVAVACRRENGQICLTKEKFVSVRKKHKILNLPLLRGVVNFVEMLMLSMHTLNLSAEIYGGEEEESRFEKWMKAHLGVGLFDVLTVMATLLGVLLSIGLFLYLPKSCVGWLESLAGGAFPLWAAGLLEGGLKVLIFILYIFLVSRMKDIRRTFSYHGAEHKSIACYEAGAELTPANAKRFTRFHPRCGTSFMFVMILLGVLLGIALRYILPAEVRNINWLYTLIRLLLLPFVVGLGFEFILYAGKHENAVVRVLSAPGLWMQRLTTREPDEGMLEVAIVSLKAALADEFPDFDAAAYPMPKKAGEKETAEGADAPEAGGAKAESAGTEEVPAGTGKADAGAEGETKTATAGAGDVPAGAEEEKDGSGAAGADGTPA